MSDGDEGQVTTRLTERTAHPDRPQPEARRMCRPPGDRHLAVEVGREPAFRKVLLALGYVLPPDAAP